MKLQELKAKYEELGREIKRLETHDTVEVELVQLPKKLELFDTGKQMTWNAAMDYAESIGMRLPTKFELQAIAESTDRFNHLGCTWSASTRSYDTTLAWFVNLGIGNTSYNTKTSSISVLCVSP
jgi:hypothetical protein